MCRPRYKIGNKVAWTNGALGTIVDGPFMGNVYRHGEHIQPYTPFSYVVEFEGSPEVRAFARMMPETALHSEWSVCVGEHRQVEGDSWEVKDR